MAIAISISDSHYLYVKNVCILPLYLIIPMFTYCTSSSFFCGLYELFLCRLLCVYISLLFFFLPSLLFSLFFSSLSLFSFFLSFSFFHSFICSFFFILFCIIAMARTTDMMLIWSSERRHTCIGPDVRGEALTYLL